MTYGAVEELPKRRNTARKGAVICPSLVLAVRVVCDRGRTVHQPTRSHVTEYCTTPLHSRCPLQISSTPRLQALRPDDSSTGV